MIDLNHHSSSNHKKMKYLENNFKINIHMKFLIISAMILLAQLKLQTATAQIEKSDSLALVDLYNSTNGPEWRFKKHWLKGPVKTWYGVAIRYNRVINLELNDNKLSGVIPESLGKLDQLQRLFVA